jgi:hypothetical protein
MDLWDIPRYEGIYALDRNSNQVWSYPRKAWNCKGYYMTKGQFLKPQIHKGYYHVGLWKDGKPKRFPLHRLIYASQHPEFDLYDSKTEVDHVARDTTNNDDLRECNRSQNVMNRLYPSKLGRRYIVQKPSGSFKVQITHPDKGKLYSKTFKTLEEALAHRNEILPIIKGDDIQYLPQDFV